VVRLDLSVARREEWGGVTCRDIPV
jgi:hypothetical protein